MSITKGQTIPVSLLSPPLPRSQARFLTPTIWPRCGVTSSASTRRWQRRARRTSGRPLVTWWNASDAVEAVGGWVTAPRNARPKARNASALFGWFRVFLERRWLGGRECITKSAALLAPFKPKLPLPPPPLPPPTSFRADWGRHKAVCFKPPAAATTTASSEIAGPSSAAGDATSDASETNRVGEGGGDDASNSP